MAKKTLPKKRKTKKQPASNGTTKAQAIRDAAQELGKKARPKDIIAALATKGISVSPQQVSTTLKAAGLRRGRRRRKAGKVIAATNGQGLNINELVQVKKLAEQLGVRVPGRNRAFCVLTVITPVNQHVGHVREPASPQGPGQECWRSPWCYALPS